jgi:sodium bicarbonate transporter 10
MIQHRHSNIAIYLIQGMDGHIPNGTKYHEIGRSMATCFTDEVFQELAYKACTPKHIIAGIDEFLDSVTVIPPGEWDPAIRIEPPTTVASQDSRKHPGQQPPISLMSEEEVRTNAREESGLVRSGRLFGGLINDIKRKIPL